MTSNEMIYMNWHEMICPDKVLLSGSSTYGKFVCEPLERGYGITIGNALRRIILSSLYGAGVVSVKIEDVLHEFSPIPGVLEDVSELILNIKELKLKVNDTETRTLELKAEGPCNVCAGDLISPDGRVEILNPDLHLATINEGGKLNVSLTVKVGRGYALARDNKDEDAPVGTIAIDTVFSPIKKVNYTVSNSRVGQKTDYDKLTLEVWTDGSLVPEDAVAYAAKILKEQMNPFINFDEDIEPEHDSVSEEGGDRDFNENLYRNVDELELSVRSANCLKNADIIKIYQLVQKTEAEMLKTKNFGRKSLNEIKEVLTEMGLSLGMKLDGFSPKEEDGAEGE
ncbi:DNA-directed RNA polymerase subunit alpha [Desulfoluna limicola]|uniref:DNA-directed RNA polymerase subunit alpha n=2 Tax=Desulfoluna limicola TaxID=2810562 RepID=A0ABN6F9X6_9BACT|nr:DNA-directed RNA polymerase subunit alpha [Desulfoluna limicola]BCS98496.1 DNA-directed RNA polymerase subunit alpha [Desulfoluna limicola]